MFRGALLVPVLYLVRYKLSVCALVARAEEKKSKAVLSHENLIQTSTGTSMQVLCPSFDLWLCEDVDIILITLCRIQAMMGPLLS